MPPTKLPSKWVVFSDLHVRADTLPLCLQILRSVAAEARSRSAGVICLGDFWHSGALLSTRQLNAVLAELNKWGPDLPMLMIPGNHDQAMRGDPSPELHALTPLGLALPGNVHVFSRPTLLDDALWAPYGTSEAQLEAACAEAAAACAPNGGLSAVFCHADIVGGLMSEDRAATVGLPPAAFPAAPVRVYSGHYHKPHVVAEPTAKGRHIRYVGSPYQTSMAEAGQQKALLVLDAAAQWAVAEEVPLDAGPRHHVLRRPPTADLDALAPALRRGDRVLVLADDATDDASLAAFAEAGRSRGAAVELREAESPSMEMGAAVDALLDGGAEGGALADLQQPAALFGAYADGRNLTAAVRDAAQRVLTECAAGGSRAAPPPLTLSLESVRLEGFGSFRKPLEYPLGGRGLLLLQGSTRREAADELADGDDALMAIMDEEAALGSNGAGKTTLAMAPFWALTGSTDARADGRPIDARGVIHDGAKRASVTLRGEIVMGDGSGGEKGGVAEPFEVTRTMGKRAMKGWLSRDPSPAPHPPISTVTRTMGKRSLPALRGGRRGAPRTLAQVQTGRRGALRPSDASPSSAPRRRSSFAHRFSLHRLFSHFAYFGPPRQDGRRARAELRALLAPDVGERAARGEWQVKRDDASALGGARDERASSPARRRRSTRCGNG